MNENESESKGKSNTGIAVPVATVIFLLYFVFPVVFLIPAYIMQRVNHHVPRAFLRFYETAFAPVDYLYGKVPLYRKLLTGEVRFWKA